MKTTHQKYLLSTLVLVIILIFASCSGGSGSSGKNNNGIGSSDLKKVIVGTWVSEYSDEHEPIYVKEIENELLEVTFYEDGSFKASTGNMDDPNDRTTIDGTYDVVHDGTQLNIAWDNAEESHIKLGFLDNDTLKLDETDDGIYWICHRGEEGDYSKAEEKGFKEEGYYDDIDSTKTEDASKLLGIWFYDDRIEGNTAFESAASYDEMHEITFYESNAFKAYTPIGDTYNGTYEVSNDGKELTLYWENGKSDSVDISYTESGDLQFDADSSYGTTFIRATETYSDYSKEWLEKYCIGSWKWYESRYIYKNKDEVFYNDEIEEGQLTDTITYYEDGTVEDSYNTYKYEVIDDGAILAYGYPYYVNEEENYDAIPRDKALERVTRNMKARFYITSDEMIETFEVNDEAEYSTYEDDEGNRADGPLIVENHYERVGD